MSAELLRKAAAILRERAEAATPGIWSTDALDHVVDMGVGQRGLGSPYAGCFYGDAAPKPENASYIATMHPGVGLALADWLDEVAGWREEGLGLMPSTNLADAWGCVECQAIAVARLIVGESND